MENTDTPMTAPTPRGVTAAEREGEPLTAEDRILMHRAFLRVVRPWEQRGVKWSVEPEYVNVMFDAVSASLRAALLAARREVEAEAEVIAAARRFVECSVRHDRTPYISENGRHGGSPWAELVEAVGDLDHARAALVATPEGP